MRENRSAVLRTYHDLLDRLSTVSPTAVTASDLEGRIVFASPRSAAVHGYPSAEAVLGRSAFEFVAPHDHARAAENLQRTLEIGTVQNIRYDLLRRDGSTFPGELSATVLLDPEGAPVGFAAFVRDLTPELEAEAALQESQERYARLVDVIPDPVVVLQDGRYVFVNDAFCRLFGYQQKDVATGLGFFALVQEKDMPAVKAQYAARLAGEDPPRTFRVDLVAKDGRVVPCETSAALIQHGGRPADLVVIRDVTLQVTAERERERHSEHLAAANRELEEANEKLRRLHRSKDELMATVSHELRTPLVTGLGYLDLLQEGHLGELSEDARDRVAVARRNLLRLSSLIDGILDYHSLVGREPTARQDQRATDLAALCRETVLDFRTRNDCPADRITLSLPEPCPLARAAPDLIRRVLDNLLDNAIRHGGSEVRIRLSVEPETQGTLRVVVSDDGVGIPRRFHERIFEPFVRPEGSGQGTGLGLAVVWHLLQLHDTQPRLRSDARQGTEIAFTLSTAPPEDASEPAAPPSEPMAAHTPLSGRVLVVDDDLDTREFLELLLRGAGFTPILTASAEAALVALTEWPPDVVLLDMSLPGMNGATFCQLVKSDPSTACVPVCMFTARAELSARASATQASCDAYLVKPVSPARLLGTLRELIQRRRSEDAPRGDI